LAISREIAISLDEKLWFKSVPGDGTSFFFTIHLALQDEKQK
jgi:signal transduction histidine kinase